MKPLDEIAQPLDREELESLGIEYMKVWRQPADAYALRKAAEWLLQYRVEKAREGRGGI